MFSKIVFSAPRMLLTGLAILLTVSASTAPAISSVSPPMGGLQHQASSAQACQPWDKTFGASGAGKSEEGNSVQQTTDGGYILLGTKYSSSLLVSGDFWLIKTDADGSKQWDKTFGGSKFDAGFDLRQTTDGGYILVGKTESFGAGDYDVWLIKYCR